MLAKSVSVVIPTYNGLSLLAKNLPPLLAALAGHAASVEIIVVDDAGNDDTPVFLREHFPNVTVIVNASNLGFAKSVNKGIFASRHEIVLALNNDVTVTVDLLAKALNWFHDPLVFSVTPNMVDQRHGKSQAITRLKPGICWFNALHLQPSDLGDLQGEIPLFFASGGASFYDREKLILLGGFDPIYHPFYVEDLDLSYRAWKAGWKCLMEPGTIVYHETSSTIGSLHKKRKIKFIGDRNRTLFLWLNITDVSMITRYFLFLPFSLLYDLVAFRKYKFLGFFSAMVYLPRIMELRTKRKKLFKVRDRDVLMTIGLSGPPRGK